MIQEKTNKVTTNLVCLSLFDCFLLFIGNRKIFAKGITSAAQSLLRHADYNNTLVTGSTLRAENTRIVSEKHVLQTVSTNKIFLSAFDNKCHILNGGIKTLPFGHYKIDHCRVEDFSWDSDEVEWDYENVLTF